MGPIAAWRMMDVLKRAHEYASVIAEAEHVLMRLQEKQED